MNDRWQLIVVGGGPAGVSAAVCAARAGLGVLLVERCGFAGGMATAALVNPFAGNCYVNPDTGRAGDIVAGLFAEVLDRLARRSAVRRCLFGPERPRYYDAFDDSQLRLVYDEMLEQAGVRALYHARLLDATTTGGRIESIRVLTKGGVVTLRADAFIDSTGDADLAASAGVPFDAGRPDDGLCQPCSLMFRMAGADKAALLADGLDAARLRVSKRFEQARQAGRLDFPFRDYVQFYDYPRPGELQFNMTRVLRLSGLDAWELSAAEREGRRQARVLTDWLAAEVPRFAGAHLSAMGAQIGVRETRRIRGRYRLCGEDVRHGRRFPDGIARSGYFIDIHSPTGAVDPHAAGSVDRRGESANGNAARPGAPRAEFVPRTYYEIPFRALQPTNVANLLVACRAISTDHQAHAATRVMATMHAVGEAAGRAAGLAAEQRCAVAELDGALVRRAVGYLDQPLGF